MKKYRIWDYSDLGDDPKAYVEDYNNSLLSEDMGLRAVSCTIEERWENSFCNYADVIFDVEEVE